MKTVKKVVAYILGLLGILLVILKIKEGDIGEADLKDSYLEGQQDALDDDINALEDDLDSPIDDLTDDEIVDSWEDL